MRREMGMGVLRGDSEGQRMEGICHEIALLRGSRSSIPLLLRGKRIISTRRYPKQNARGENERGIQPK